MPIFGLGSADPGGTRAGPQTLHVLAEIVYLYDLLLRIEPTPIVELNRAVAVAMRDGPDAGLALVDDLLARGDLADIGWRMLLALTLPAAGQVCGGP